jgi:hypothetical protein
VQGPTQPTTQIGLIQGGATVTPTDDPDDDQFDVSLPLTEEPVTDWRALFAENASRAPPEPAAEVDLRIVFSPVEGHYAIAYSCRESLVRPVLEAVKSWIADTNDRRASLAEAQAREDAEASARRTERANQAVELQDLVNRSI